MEWRKFTGNIKRDRALPNIGTTETPKETELWRWVTGNKSWHGRRDHQPISVRTRSSTQADEWHERDDPDPENTWNDVEENQEPEKAKTETILTPEQSVRPATPS